MAATGRATSEWEGEDMKERRSFRTISMKGEESSVRDDIGRRGEGEGKGKGWKGEGGDY